MNKRTVTICIDDDITDIFTRMKAASINRSAFICNLLRAADARNFNMTVEHSADEEEKPLSPI